MSFVHIPLYDSDHGGSLDFHRYIHRVPRAKDVEERITNAVRHSMALAAERGESWLGEHETVKNKVKRLAKLKQFARV